MNAFLLYVESYPLSACDCRVFLMLSAQIVSGDLDFRLADSLV